MQINKYLILLSTFILLSFLSCFAEQEKMIEGKWSYQLNDSQTGVLTTEAIEFLPSEEKGSFSFTWTKKIKDINGESIISLKTGQAMTTIRYVNSEAIPTIKFFWTDTTEDFILLMKYIIIGDSLTLVTDFAATVYYKNENEEGVVDET